MIVYVFSVFLKNFPRHFLEIHFFLQIIIKTSSINHGTRQLDGYVISPRLNAIMDSPFGQPSIHPLLVRNTSFLVNFTSARVLKPYLISSQQNPVNAMHFLFHFFILSRLTKSRRKSVYAIVFVPQCVCSAFLLLHYVNGAFVIYSFRYK